MQLKINTQIGKIDCYINFAVRAGKVIWGVDNLERGANSAKQLSLYCQRKNTMSLTLPTDYLNNLLKRSNIKVLSITDESLANAIIKYCK